MHEDVIIALRTRAIRTKNPYPTQGSINSYDGISHSRIYIFIDMGGFELYNNIQMVVPTSTEYR